MKNKIFAILFLGVLFSCSNDCRKTKDNPSAINQQITQELGLTANNIYPFYPNTWSAGLGDNMWYDRKVGDTLIVYRRDAVSDDSGNELEYRFLVKPKNWIVPQNYKLIVCDASSGNPCFTAFNKKIANFRIQQYIENKILACEIETPNESNASFPLIDRMWIKLDD